jgi:membrane protein required for colicin V production
MVIDIIVFGLMVLALFKGLTKGFVLAVFSFFAFIIGLAAAIKLSAIVAGYLSTTTNIGSRWLPVLAFAIVFILVAILVRLGAKAIEGALRMAMLGWANKIGGVLLYMLLYLFIFSVLLFYAQQLNLIKPKTFGSSVCYPFLQPLAPRVISVLGAVLPFFRNMFAQLEHFFEGLSSSAS